MILADMLGTDYPSWAAGAGPRGVAQFKGQLSASYAADPATFGDAWAEFLRYNPEAAISVALPLPAPAPAPTLEQATTSPLVAPPAAIAAPLEVVRPALTAAPVLTDYSNYDAYRRDLIAWYTAHPDDVPARRASAERAAERERQRETATKYMGRAPTEAELDSWISYYGTPEQLAQLDANIMASRAQNAVALFGDRQEILRQLYIRRTGQDPIATPTLSYDPDNESGRAPYGWYSTIPDPVAGSFWGGVAGAVADALPAIVALPVTVTAAVVAPALGKDPASISPVDVIDTAAKVAPAAIALPVTLTTALIGKDVTSKEDLAGVTRIGAALGTKGLSEQLLTVTGLVKPPPAPTLEQTPAAAPEYIVLQGPSSPNFLWVAIALGALALL